MSRRSFDVAVVGAGPTAVAALQAFLGGESIAVISGALRSAVPWAAVHPKIQAVSVSRDEAPGVVPVYRRSTIHAKPLLSSALAGGFANYWGQQFLRYESGDHWPRDVFDDFSSYQAHCEAVERGFVLTGGSDMALRPEAKVGYVARVPRLLVGVAHEPAADLMAMRFAFRHEVSRTRAEVFDTRALTFEHAQGGWWVRLQDGERIFARRLLLAAGVLGTAQLLGNAFPDIERLRLSDHGPWMLYGMGLRHLFAQRPSLSRHHFNAITLEKLEQGACTAFASLYDMRRAELNLLLASTIGRSFKAFRKLRAPIGSALIRPVQIWTPSTFDDIDIDPQSGTAKEVPRAQNDARRDRRLDEVLDVLRSQGARCLKVSRTLPGYGFHYHNLRVKSAGGELVSVADFLRRETDGEVTCVDASILSTIGLRPHTLTAMAASHMIVSRM